MDAVSLPGSFHQIGEAVSRISPEFPYTRERVSSAEAVSALASLAGACVRVHARARARMRTREGRRSCLARPRGGLIYHTPRDRLPHGTRLEEPRRGEARKCSPSSEEGEVDEKEEGVGGDPSRGGSVDSARARVPQRSTPLISFLSVWLAPLSGPDVNGTNGNCSYGEGAADKSACTRARLRNAKVCKNRPGGALALSHRSPFTVYLGLVLKPERGFALSLQRRGFPGIYSSKDLRQGHSEFETLIRNRE